MAAYLAFGLHADVLRDAGVEHVLDPVVGEHGVDVDRVGVAADDVIRRLDDDRWVLPRLAVVPAAKRCGLKRVVYKRTKSRKSVTIAYTQPWPASLHSSAAPVL